MASALSLVSEGQEAGESTLFQRCGFDLCMKTGNRPVEASASPRSACSYSRIVPVPGIDDGMAQGPATTRVHQAVLDYAPKRLGLDVDPALRKPQDQQMLLLTDMTIRRPVQ
jgi:hypothetical protein